MGAETLSFLFRCLSLAATIGAGALVVAMVGPALAASERESASSPRTLHVAPEGSKEGAEAPSDPLPSLEAALRRVRDASAPSEVVLHAGSYRGGVRVEGPVSKGDLPELTLRAARTPSGGFARVVFEGGRRIPSARPVEGSEGVYRTELAGLVFSREPQLWEEDTGVRYRLVADRAAVARFPGSFWYSPSAVDGEGETPVYIHTSDGAPPGAHRLWRSSETHGLTIQRSDVTVRGLRFRNFVGWRWAAGVTSKAPRTKIEDSHVRNATQGFAFGRGASESTLEGCSARDVGGGVYVQADDVTVEGCRLFSARGSFALPAVPQDDAGLVFYHPSSGGAARRNLAVGFRHGLTVKRRSSPFVAEENTFVHPAGEGWRGFGSTQWHPESRFRWNVIAGYRHPVGQAAEAPAETRLGGNCVDSSKAAGRLPAKLGTSSEPVFVDPASEDFRLLAGSPCAAGGGSERAPGAAGVAPEGVAPAGLPRVRARLAPPAKRARSAPEADRTRGAPGETIDAPALWLAPERAVTLHFEVEGTSRRVAASRVRVGEGPWSEPRVGLSPWTLELPESEEPVRVWLGLRDARGTWHEVDGLRVLASAGGPRAIGAPAHRSSAQGVVATVATDRPCALRLEHGPTADRGSALRAAASEARRRSEGEDVWLQTVTLRSPREHPGSTLHWRLVARDALGRETEVDRGSLALTGPGRALHVDPEGEDAPSRGAAARPLATLQYAVDRALPGDRVVLAPGLHTAPATLTRGGTAEAPLVLEAAEPGRAVLDGGRSVETLIRLVGAPHVVVEGLELRWFRRAAIAVEGSAHVTVRGTHIWNDFWFGSVGGTGIHANGSPSLSIVRNVIYRSSPAMRLVASPRARILHNTTAANTGGGVQLFRSVAGTVLRHNSFAFEGMQAYRLKVDSPKDLESFESDWNNLGLHYRKPLDFEQHAIRSDRRQLETQNRALARQSAKYLVRLEGVPRGRLPDRPDPSGEPKLHAASPRDLRFYSLEDWRRASGRDRNSIFADPQYVDPEAGDFRLAPRSPNVGAGRDGATLGALGVAR